MESWKFSMYSIYVFSNSMFLLFIPVISERDLGYVLYIMVPHHSTARVVPARIHKLALPYSVPKEAQVHSCCGVVRHGPPYVLCVDAQSPYKLPT